jgi:hypothetical protein
MSIMKNDKPAIDPELEPLLDLLRDTPARDPRAVERGRAKYTSDVDKMFASNKAGNISWFDKLLTFGWLGQNREKAGMRRSMQLSTSVLLVALVLVVILFSGAGATAYAAQSALPGDALYRVKMTIEQTRVSLAADAAKRADLHLEFAEHRLDEISGLIAEGRYGEIERATQEFEYHVQQALTAMQTVAASDPLRAQELAARVTAALSEYARTLTGMMMNVPEDSRASMERAIITSQNAGNLPPAQFNENESENENINNNQSNSNGDDHSLDQSNQNGGFFNENENHNGVENTNQNSNENEGSNENINNQNGSDDQNSNSNLNDQDNNQNDSENDNDNDRHGGNDNDHDRDKGGNDNDSGGNDNGGDD